MRTQPATEAAAGGWVVMKISCETTTTTTRTMVGWGGVALFVGQELEGQS